MPPKQDTKKPKDSKPATTKGTKGTKGSGGGVKIVNLDDEWLYHSR
jgi:hypothetical protein